MTNILRHKDRGSTRWKNGGGSTVEVASAPAGATLADFTWRISIADVTNDGPFSEFIGVDRNIVVIDGAGMALEIAGTEHILKPMQPFKFSGEVTTTARLIDGPTRDLNIMIRRRLATASLTFYVIEPHTNVNMDVNENEELVVLTGSGSLTITDKDAQSDILGTSHRQPDRHVLTFLDAAHKHGPAYLELDGDGLAIVIRIRNLSPLSHG